MKRLQIQREDEARDSDEGDAEELEDPVPALLASLLLVMTCPFCEGQGTDDKGARCQCRKVGYEVALDTLENEGLVT